MNQAEADMARANPDPDAGDKFLRQQLTMGRLSEGQFTDILIAAARLYYGWRVIHIRPAMKANGKWVTPVSGDGEGFPDLLMVRRSTRQEVAAELKVGRNTPSESQRDWLRDFEACGVPGYVWYPEDLAEIQAVMRHGIDMEIEGTAS